MKKHNYLKRLDRIQKGLRLPAGDKVSKDWVMLFGVPNLDQAILRARRKGSTFVMFVPANGGTIQYGRCCEPDHGQSRGSVAYEIAEPADIDSKRPLKHCSTDQVQQIFADMQSQREAHRANEIADGAARVR